MPQPPIKIGPHEILTRFDRSRSKEGQRKTQRQLSRRSMLRNDYAQHLHFDRQREKITRNVSVNRDKQNEQNRCVRCESLKAKHKEREDHFKQVIELYHHEMDMLKHINEELREQLESISLKALNNQREIRELKDELRAFTKASLRDLDQPIKKGQSKRQIQLAITPIGHSGSAPIIIKRLTHKLKIESDESEPNTDQNSSFHSTPTKLDSNPMDQRQKQNALKAEFQRLMNECQSTSNRSKKTTLRKQLANIANQLCGISREQEEGEDY